MKHKLKEWIEKDSPYKVILAYNMEQEQESCIAINLQTVQNMYHGNNYDFEYQMSIVGFTFITDDKTGQGRDQMCDYVTQKLKSFEDEQLSFKVIDSIDYESDESIHTFTVNFKLYTQENQI